MKMRPNKPTVFLLTAAMLLSGLSSAAPVSNVSAEDAVTAASGYPESSESSYNLNSQNSSGGNPEKSDEPAELPDSENSTENYSKEVPQTPEDSAAGNPFLNGTGLTSDIHAQDEKELDFETPAGKKKARIDDAGGVTFETTGDYTHSIYANGQPLIIETSTSVLYAKLYLDSNENGIGEAEEEITAFKGDGLPSGNGIFYADGYGYFLPNSTIYGGAKEGTCNYDTSITLTGTSDTSGKYTVWAIYGGSQSGTLTGDTHVNVSGGNPYLTCGGNADGALEGNTHVDISGGNIEFAYGGSTNGLLTGDTHVNISGGTVSWTYGGCNTAELNGNTSIHMTGGNEKGNIYGGSAVGQINGSTSIHIKAGQITSVYGGNKDSGLITGNTDLIFDAGADAAGWIYGGGAGYSNTAITEVAGSTNITFNGGTFSKNIYGGGGWRGAEAANSTITVNGGTFNGWIYGGGEEASSVSGNVSITVNGGTLTCVCATGAGFNGTAASVNNAKIHLKGGTVNQFSALPNNNAAITGDLSLTLSGDTFSNTELYLGQSGNPAGLKNVTVSLTDSKAKLLNLQSPVAGNLTVNLERGDIGSLILLQDTLKNAKEAALTYTDCGSSTGRFGTFVQGASNYFTDIDNPLLVGSYLNKNRFTSITLQNSYVNYYDDTVSGDDNSLRTCAGTLLVDGGALRVTGNMLTDMPATEFRNNPLLIRTSAYYEGLHFTEDPVGSARLQWMNTDGTGIPENMQDISIVETSSDAPDSTFAAADSGYAIKRDTGSRSDSTGQIWQGTVWYTGKTKDLCKCQVLDSYLEKTLFPLPEGNASASLTLRDALTGSVNLSSSCLVIGHRGTAPEFTYSVIPEGTTIPDAAINGDTLTVVQTGAVHIQVTQELNGKTTTYDIYVNVLQIPQENSFRFTKELAEDISLTFSGNGMEFAPPYSYIWDDTNHRYLDYDAYSMTLEDGALKFILKKDYLDRLDLGEYDFHAAAYMNPDTGSGKRYDHFFKVTIALPTEVKDPVIELPKDRYQYDGLHKTPSVTVKDGDTVIPSKEYTVSYQDNLKTGTATVTITDNPGGNYIVNGKATFEIVNDYHPEDGVDYLTTPLKDGWTNQDFTITATDGHLLATGNTLTDEWVTKLTGTSETDGSFISFYVKDVKTGAISLMATEQYKLDRTDPEDYDIRFNENSVKKLIHEVTFGMLFGKTVDVKITVGDTLSGIGSLSYYLSDTVLTTEQVRTITDWTAGSRFSITAKDAERFIVYVKAEDRAGNLVCFASDGAEFDLAPPAITGITDNTTYYTTQLAVVTDKHPGIVTLNDQKVSGDITLPGNVDETYVIKAADQVGNTCIVTVTMKPVKDIAVPISGLTKDSVTSDSQPDIHAVITELDLLLESEHLTEQEKAEIEGLRKEAEILNTQIASASDAADTKEIQAVDGISKDTVSPDDKENLEKAKDALETALEKYSENYTETEKAAIEEDIARIDESLKSIQKVQTVADAIQKLPDAEEVSPDDEETENAAREIEALLESLTEHERSLVDTTRLQQVLDALTDYRILEGDHSQWEYDSSQNLVFKANGPVSKFTGILIDDKPVDDKNYTVASGSTILTLKAAYLDTLSAGTHSLTVVYSDGETSAVFETHQKTPDDDQNKPDDGDNTDKPSGDDNTDKPSDGQDTNKPGASDGSDHTNKPSGGIPVNRPSNNNNAGRPDGSSNTGSSSSRPDSAQTSDGQDPWLWFVLLLGSGVSAAGVTYYKQKRSLSSR
ncbi:MAG: hypothetical protein K1W22_06860 [Lachnospiraceae bacterium]